MLLTEKQLIAVRAGISVVSTSVCLLIRAVILSFNPGVPSPPQAEKNVFSPPQAEIFGIFNNVLGFKLRFHDVSGI